MISQNYDEIQFINNRQYLLLNPMEDESLNMEFQSFKAYQHINSNKEAMIDTELFSDHQLPKEQEERSSSRSLQHSNRKESQYRNFAKHYTRTIKNIIKSHIYTWPLDQTTQSLAQQMVKQIERIYHPPKKLIEAIFCCEVNIDKFRKMGYGSLVDNFTRQEIINSCSRIKQLVLSHVSREDADLMIGKKIGNPKLFTEYVKKVTKEYQHSNRFSYRLRPNISRQIIEGAMKRQNYNIDLAALVLDRDEPLEKFGQQQSNFLDCL